MALCAEMNEKCTLIAVAWDGIIPALLTDKFDMIGSGKAYVKPLLSHSFSVREIASAFQMAESRADNCMKISMETTW